MRLTNFMREAFVRAVMADVPKKDYSEEIIRTAKEAIHNAMPKEIMMLIVLKDEKPKQWLTTAYMRLPDGCSSFRYYRPEDGFYLKDTSPEHWKKLEELGRKSMEQINSLRELERKLSTCANACSTRKQLLEMLPEFEKYLPDDETKAVKSYPMVANVVSEFVKAGWPKNKNAQA